MTKSIVSPKSEANSKGSQYLPIKDFFENMVRSKEANPYTSIFSFAPYIDKAKTCAIPSDDVNSKKNELAKEFENQLTQLANLAQEEDLAKRQAVVRMFFPSLFFKGQMGFIGKPFSKEFFYATPELQQVFTSDDWEVKLSGQLMKGKMSSPALEAGKLILNTFHGQKIDSSSYEILTLRHKKTRLERHYKINVILDYIHTKPLQGTLDLSEEQIHRLLNDWENDDLWLKKFPPDHYVFEGMVIGYMQDVTDVEILSQMKAKMVTDKQETDQDPNEIRQYLRDLISSYLRMPDLDFGNLLNRDFRYAQLISWSILGNLEVLNQFNKEDFCQSSTYGQVMAHDKAVIVADLQKLEQPGKVEAHLINLGYRSLLLSPQVDKSGKIVGIMELASKKPYRFNNQIFRKLKEVISLYSVGSNRWIELLDNNVNLFIQKQFTYIHPSVEWKFTDVSQKFIFSPWDSDKPPSLEPIVFKNVYPLYGQADIVGSSKIRNESIQADMLDNLQRVGKTIKTIRRKIDFQLLDIYSAKVEAFTNRLEKGGYISSDESQIVELLTQEIHPLLREMGEKYDQLPATILKKYFDYLDPRLDIVYRKRKHYEDSVHELNEMISGFIDKEVAKKQEVLPHFFEKYITDGVEYNIYVGQSILQTGTFSDYFLKDFRLWQLIQMCEVTRLVEKNGKKLLVPLRTAQLVFIYNNALSIRFNMDEKQFDVDGAYNVRYEILKKRIDKAVIKGTSERLTQAGKVAMVWLQEKDRIEYLEYIAHLQREGYTTGEVEELELEKLQGADGLKALRVTVAL